MPSRKLEDLHPDMRRLAEKFLALCHDRGLDVLVTCTYRSNAEQAECYAQGRTKPGAIVTRAKPGESAHNHTDKDGNPRSLALDVVPMRHGKPVWSTKGNGLDENPADDYTDDLELWQRVGQAGVEAGLDWYGLPTASFREFPHFQHPRTKELRKG